MSIRVIGSHHAAFAQLDCTNTDITDGDYPADPVAFIQTIYAGDEDVGAKAALINVDRLHSAIGGDEQRQNVKALRLRNLFQVSRLANGRANQRKSFGGVPWMTIDGCMAFYAKLRAESEQFGFSS